MTQLTITIKGEKFTYNAPYTEGYSLKPNEASALNGLLGENLRNNFASKVEKAKEEGNFDLAALQTEFDTYAAEYEFGTRRAGGGGGTGLPKDPTEREAHLIAREMIREHAKSKGVKVEAEWVNNQVPALLAKRPDIMEEATRRVAARNSISIEEIELPEDTGESEAEGESEDSAQGQDDTEGSVGAVDETNSPDDPAETSPARSRRNRA